MAKDILGGFNIPSHLMARAAAYVPPKPKVVKPKVKPTTAKASKIILTNSWRKITTYKASKGTAIHTVEGRLGISVAELKCSCQGFRIQKKGFCKHTVKAKAEFGL